MTNSLFQVLSCAFVVGCCLVACAGPKEGAPGDETPEAQASAFAAAPLTVYTVNYPLAYFAERIGGERVEAVLPAPPDVDPANWSPDPDTVAAYQGADLILLNGAGYAKWVARSSLPESRLIDTSAPFREELLPLEGVATHTHGPGGEHVHAGWAFTTWLDPALAKEHARAVAAALAGASPADAALFADRLAGLEADLESLDRRLTATRQTLADRPVLFSHPVYQYLIRRYGLNARSVHWEPGEMPGEEMWHELEGILEHHPARLMIWEGEPLPDLAERLEALGIASIVFDPCANTPADGDLMSVMERNSVSLEGAAGPGSS